MVSGTDLRLSHTKSCGCWRVESPSHAFTTHGMVNSSEYRIWSHIKTRCFNAKSRFYERYGGRGIGMCLAWVDSFESFYDDMGPRPTPRHSIDRIDNDGHYEPGNCRWATPAQQSANRSTVRNFEFNGVTDSIAGWSRRSGVPYPKLYRRLAAGWPFARAIESKDAAVRALLAKDPA